MSLEEPLVQSVGPPPNMKQNKNKTPVGQEVRGDSKGRWCWWPKCRHEVLCVGGVGGGNGSAVAFVFVTGPEHAHLSAKN